MRRRRSSFLGGICDVFSFLESSPYFQYDKKKMCHQSLLENEAFPRQQVTAKSFLFQATCFIPKTNIVTHKCFTDVL